jgi:hypothetical protein
MRFAFMVIGSLIAASAAFASAQSLTGDSIKSRIIGNTIGGGMADNTRFTEYYAVDGEIRGADGAGKPYRGKWSVDGDRMCFQYGEDRPGCFELRLTGTVVEFYTEAGQFAGVGALQAGNPLQLR